jgi:ubiquinone/menaquinone biosynthesis C-methylase UbiE
MYESFQLNYRKYYTESRGTAEWLKNHIGKHVRFENARILDWGCGPGRVIRHMPEVVDNQCQYFGTDYNKKSIAWCKKNIPHVEFNLNGLEAKLPYETNFFDAIYGISIFTHLSESLHVEWYKELYRVLKPGGVLFITTQGNRHKIKLSESEKEMFDRGQLVVRGKVKEGHRTYSAFHPKPFMKKLFENAQILEHIDNEPSKGTYIPQDIWMVRK